MKRTIIISILIALSYLSYSQSFNQLSFRKLNGDTVWTSSYAGKKVMFYIAPLSQSDSAFIQLQAFKARYGDTVQIVGILSIEDGFQNSNASSIEAMYAGIGIVLTEGMYTKKQSGANQSSLMKWLTDKNMNRHFNMDAKGIGHKFFVGEGGRLFGVMPPPVSLSASIINTIVHSSTQ
jgi:glutathione peroxidase